MTFDSGMWPLTSPKMRVALLHLWPKFGYNPSKYAEVIVYGRSRANIAIIAYGKLSSTFDLVHKCGLLYSTYIQSVQKVTFDPIHKCMLSCRTYGPSWLQSMKVCRSYKQMLTLFTSDDYTETAHNPGTQHSEHTQSSSTIFQTRGILKGA